MLGAASFGTGVIGIMLGGAVAYLFAKLGVYVLRKSEAEAQEVTHAGNANNS